MPLAWPDCGDRPPLQGAWGCAAGGIGPATHSGRPRKCGRNPSGPQDGAGCAQCGCPNPSGGCRDRSAEARLRAYEGVRAGLSKSAGGPKESAAGGRFTLTRCYATRHTPIIGGRQHGMTKRGPAARLPGAHRRSARPAPAGARSRGYSVTRTWRHLEGGACRSTLTRGGTRPAARVTPLHNHQRICSRGG